MTYPWISAGAHVVVFRVKDVAGNERCTASLRSYRNVSARPSFSLRPPEPGARRLRITVHASESVRVSLLVTQVGRGCCSLRRYVSFWGDKEAGPLGAAPRRRRQGHPGHQRFRARPRRQRSAALPQCVVDPVTGQGALPRPRDALVTVRHGPVTHSAPSLTPWPESADRQGSSWWHCCRAWCCSSACSRRPACSRSARSRPSAPRARVPGRSRAEPRRGPPSARFCPARSRATCACAWSRGTVAVTLGVPRLLPVPGLSVGAAER